MNAIEQVLTPQELKLLGTLGFHPHRIFGKDCFETIGPVILVGDQLNSAYFKRRRGITHGLLGELPECCAQQTFGVLYFYALTGGRRLVEFRTCANDFKSYYVKRVSASSFLIYEFPHMKTNDTFNHIGEICLVRQTGDVWEHEATLKTQNIPGFLTLSYYGRDNGWESIGFNDSQWNIIWNMLNAWLPSDATW